jgi:hypothetical protein
VCKPVQRYFLLAARCRVVYEFHEDSQSCSFARCGSLHFTTDGGCMTTPSHARDSCRLGSRGRSMHVGGLRSSARSQANKCRYSSGSRLTADQPGSIAPCLDRSPRQAGGQVLHLLISAQGAVEPDVRGVSASLLRMNHYENSSDHKACILAGIVSPYGEGCLLLLCWIVSPALNDSRSFVSLA